MNTNNKVVVQTKDGLTTQILTSLDFGSFKQTITKNESYQLDFTAYDDKSLAFNLLTNENSVWWGTQQYIIKQVSNNNDSGRHSVSVTATHILYQLNNRRQYNKNEGDKMYSLQTALAFLFSGINDYSYVIKGSFSGSFNITDFGGSTITDGISTIRDTFSVYAVIPDNKMIYFYDKDTYVKKTNNVFRYRNDTSSVQLQIDSSDMVNRVMVSGKITPPKPKPAPKPVLPPDVKRPKPPTPKKGQKPLPVDKSGLVQQLGWSTAYKADGYTPSSFKKLQDLIVKGKAVLADAKATQQQVWDIQDSLHRAGLGLTRPTPPAPKPITKQIFVEDKDSISQWGVKEGEAVNSDNVISLDAMTNLGKKSFKLQPSISLTINYLESNSINLGDIWTVQIIDMNYISPFEIVSIVLSPFTQTATQVTLNNTVSNFLDLQKAQNSAVSTAKTINPGVMWVVGTVGGS